MPVEQGPRAVRIFVSSPSDVGEERAFVHQLLDTELKYKRAFLGKLSFEVVSWDNPAAPTPMTARLTPQEAVNRFRGKPSDCDIVIVILWSRLGGHLIIDGMPYLSGTEYEYEEAASAQPPPEILVYRRTEKVLLDADDTEFDRKRQQRQRALSFFDRFGRPDGPFSGGINEYATPTDFKNLLTKNLREILTERLEVQSIGRPISTSAQPPVWQGHPYPGLRAFMTTEAAIFFGRGRETDALVAELRKPDRRFTAVVGASGSGKSSLVYAGLMPRLAEGAIEGSADWQAVYFKPGAFGDNPFLALAAELKLLLPSGDGDEPIVIADALARAPGSIAPYFDRVLAGAPSSTRLVLFADQSEEIFAQVASSRREPLVNLLAEASGHPRTQVVLTMREDFLSQATRYPRLAALLQTGTFVLGVPGPAALADMIRRPAQLAGLTLDEDLADEILKDVGNELGALPLVAFCLETLYLSRGTSHHLTRKAYEAVGRLQGVVRRRVAEILLPLRKRVETEVALAKLFRLLVHIDAAGAVSRRRAFRDELRDGPLLEKMVEVLITGRLLVADDPKRATISLAHEVLLTAWPALRSWVKTHRAELQRLDRALSSLDSVNPLDRSYAVQALGEIGPVVPDIVPALVTSLGDADFDVRRNAVESLARFGSPAIPALVAALKDADATVRMHAAEALEDTGPPAVGAVQGLITALGDGDEFVRMTVAAALGKIGLPAGQAVPALVAALSDTNETVRENAAEALEAIGPPGILALVAALKDADATVRMHAAEALEDTGPPAVGAVQGLITALGDGDEFVRMTAAAALGKFGLPAVEAVPALVAALSDTNETVRENAAEALEAMGLPIILALITALSKADTTAREYAARILDRIGPRAVTVLTTALRDVDKTVRMYAASTLRRIGQPTPEAVQALIRALGDTDQTVRECVAEILTKVGPRAVAALATALGDPDQTVRGYAAEALLDIKISSVPALITLLSSEDDIVREHAAGALANIGPRAVAVLTTGLSRPDATFRRHAFRALEQLGPLGVAALSTALRKVSPDVRMHAARALGRIGPAAAEAVPGLIRALGDAHDYVRMHVTCPQELVIWCESPGC